MRRYCGVGQLYTLFELLPRFSGVNRLCGQSDAVLHAGGGAGDVQRRSAVQQDHVSRRSFVTVKNRSKLMASPM